MSSCAYAPADAVEVLDLGNYHFEMDPLLLDVSKFCENLTTLLLDGIGMTDYGYSSLLTLLRIPSLRTPETVVVPVPASVLVPVLVSVPGMYFSYSTSTCPCVVCHTPAGYKMWYSTARG
jgi:hypothetical protein